MQFISTTKAPSAIGPYSQGVMVGNMVYTSGQIALSPDGSEDILSQGVEKQTIQVLKNLQAVLSEANSDKSKVIKTTIFLASMDDFSVVNEIYADFFDEHKPARATVAVKTLPKNALVEIDAIAVIK